MSAQRYAQAGRETADGYGRAVSFLESKSAGRVRHLGGSLLAHLKGTHDLLRRWGSPEFLCLAGLCHAAYGTDGFPTALLGLERRAELGEAIGPRAEEVVYFYASCDRARVYPQIGRVRPVQFRDRFSGEVFVPADSLFFPFLELTFANELEIVRGKPALIESTRGTLADLFGRCRGMISDPTYEYFASTYGVRRGRAAP
jgi:hypothetical protein